MNSQIPQENRGLPKTAALPGRRPSRSLHVLPACLSAAFLALASLPAGEVKTRVTEADALKVEKDFNKFGKENVSVRVDPTKKNADYHGRGERGYKIQILGNGADPAVVEFCYLVNDPEEGSSVKVAGRGICAVKNDEFEFTIKASHSSKSLKGWFVRVVKNGQVIGVAGSSPKYEEMAASARTQVDYAPN